MCDTSNGNKGRFWRSSERTRFNWGCFRQGFLCIRILSFQGTSRKCKCTWSYTGGHLFIPLAPYNFVSFNYFAVF
jgi:hypothetical protein